MPEMIDGSKACEIKDWIVVNQDEIKFDLQREVDLQLDEEQQSYWK